MPASKVKNAKMSLEEFDKLFESLKNWGCPPRPPTETWSLWKAWGLSLLGTPATARSRTRGWHTSILSCNRRSDSCSLGAGVTF